KIAIVGANARIVDVDHDATFALVSAALARGRGVLFFSGHFANWEALSFIAAQLGFGGGIVYRPQNNPLVDRWLVRQRAKNGPRDQITKGPRGTRRIFSLLRQGGTIALLVDKKTNEGVPTQFFG